MKTKVPRLVAAGCVLSLAIAGTSVAVRLTSPASADSAASLQAASPGDPLDAAVRTAERLVQGRAAELKASPADAFVQHQTVTTPWGLQYVSYERTYQDLPVIGGDFVVTTDAQGNNRGLTVAQQRPINVSRIPTVKKAAAIRTARATLDVADPATGDPSLVVYAGGKEPVLAWEAVVKGKDKGEPSHQKVYVDARSGKVLKAVELTASGTGTGAWNGANLAIGSTQSGSTFTMSDPARPNLRCGDLATGKTYTGADDV